MVIELSECNLVRNHTRDFKIKRADSVGSIWIYELECSFGSVFPKSCLKVGGAAYTRVQLIHECLRYSFLRTKLLKLLFLWFAFLLHVIISGNRTVKSTSFVEYILDHSAKKKRGIYRLKVQTMVFLDSRIITFHFRKSLNKIGNLVLCII